MLQMSSASGDDEKEVLKENSAFEAIAFRDAVRQIIASCLSFTLVIQVGSSLSYSAILLPQLEHDSSMKVNEEQQSWIGRFILSAL